VGTLTSEVMGIPSSASLAYRGGAMQEFSEVRTVASRNSLHHTLALNVALGVWQRAKCGSTPFRLV
jgi:hypothetical protein